MTTGLIQELRTLLDELAAYTMELIDDEWGTQKRPYSGSFEEFEDLLRRIEALRD